MSLGSLTDSFAATHVNQVEPEGSIPFCKASPWWKGSRSIIAVNKYHIIRAWRTPEEEELTVLGTTRGKETRNGILDRRSMDDGMGWDGVVPLSFVSMQRRGSPRSNDAFIVHSSRVLHARGSRQVSLLQAVPVKVALHYSEPTLES